MSFPPRFVALNGIEGLVHFRMSRYALFFFFFLLTYSIYFRNGIHYQ